MHFPKIYWNYIFYLCYTVHMDQVCLSNVSCAPPPVHSNPIIASAAPPPFLTPEAEV